MLREIAVVASILTTLVACAVSSTPTSPLTPTAVPISTPTSATVPTSVRLVPAQITPKMEKCVSSLRIRLQGELPDTLTVQVTESSNMSCTFYFATAREIRYMSKYREYSVASPEFSEVSQNLPPDSLCESGAPYYTASGYIRNDRSLDSLRVCCAEKAYLAPALSILRYGGPVYNAQGAIEYISFFGYTPARLTLTFYLPDRTVTTTVTPDYYSYDVCKGAEITIDLEGTVE